MANGQSMLKPLKTRQKLQDCEYLFGAYVKVGISQKMLAECPFLNVQNFRFLFVCFNFDSNNCYRAILSTELLRHNKIQMHQHCSQKFPNPFDTLFSTPDIECKSNLNSSLASNLKRSVNLRCKFQNFHLNQKRMIFFIFLP